MSSALSVIPISRLVLADPPLGMRVQPLEPAVLSDPPEAETPTPSSNILGVGIEPRQYTAVDLVATVGLYRRMLMEHVDVAEVPLDVGRKQGMRRTAGLEQLIDAGPGQARDVADVGTGPRALHDRRGPVEDSAIQRAEPAREHLSRLQIVLCLGQLVMQQRSLGGLRPCGVGDGLPASAESA